MRELNVAFLPHVHEASQIRVVTTKLSKMLTTSRNIIKTACIRALSAPAISYVRPVFDLDWSGYERVSLVQRNYNPFRASCISHHSPQSTLLRLANPTPLLQLQALTFNIIKVVQARRQPNDDWAQCSHKASRMGSTDTHSLRRVDSNTPSIAYRANCRRVGKWV
jgi:hypothetical protein